MYRFQVIRFERQIDTDGDDNSANCNKKLTRQFVMNNYINKHCLQFTIAKKCVYIVGFNERPHLHFLQARPDISCSLSNNYILDNVVRQ